MGSARTKVFISYSHADGVWLDKVKKALKPLEKEHGDAIWHDQRLEPGSAWADDIQSALDSAKVAVLLVTRDFMASDFIGGKELPPLLKAAKDDGAIILPLHVGRSAFVEDKSLGKIQGVNDPAKPLKAMTEDEQDQALENLRRFVNKALVGPAAIAAAAQSVATAARTVADAAQVVAEVAQSAAVDAETDPGAADDDGGYEMVDGLADCLQALVDSESEVTEVEVCLVDAEGELSPVMRLELDGDGDLLLVVPATEQLPEALPLPDKLRKRLAGEFDLGYANDDDDGDDSQLRNFGSAAEADLDEVAAVVCAMLDEVFELPDDDFGLAARPAPEAEVVDGLAAALDDLMDSASDVMAVEVCVVDADDEQSPILRVDRDVDGDLMLWVLPSDAFPEGLAEPDGLRKRLRAKLGFVPASKDDDSLGRNFGAGADVDLAVVTDAIDTIVGTLLELPNDDFTLVAATAEG